MQVKVANNNQINFTIYIFHQSLDNNDMVPFFSVIIPIYNKEKYLAETIESILNQTIGDWELILIDDGSKDNSKSIIQRYETSSNVRCFFNDNSGPFDERIFGAKKAKGKYLIFLDADDLLHKEALECFLQEINNHDFVKFNICFLYRNDKRFEQHFVLNSVEDYKKAILNGEANNICSTIIKKDIFLMCLNDFKMMPRCFSAEDMLMQLPIIDRINSILYIDKPLYFYRFVDESLARKPIDIDCLDRHINQYRVTYLLQYAKKWSMDFAIKQIYYQSFIVVYDVFCKCCKQYSVFRIISSIRKHNWLSKYCGGADAYSFIKRVNLNKRQKSVCLALYDQNVITILFHILFFKLKKVLHR